jgi:hypothetical protein
MTLLLASHAVAGCGNNMFASGERKDPAEDAAIALERGDEDEAISILEAALTDDPENWNYVSVLGAAYAQRAGVEPLSIAQGMAEQTTSGGDESDDSASATSQGDMVDLFGIMPAATEASLADIDHSIELLATIPADARTNGDAFKIAIYQTCSMVMHMKILDTDADGELSLEEITNLSDLGASGLLVQLAGAQALAAGGGSETMAKAAESLEKYQAQIDAAPGDTQEDKLRNYLAKTQATTPTTTP